MVDCWLSHFCSAQEQEQKLVRLRPGQAGSTIYLESKFDFFGSTIYLFLGNFFYFFWSKIYFLVVNIDFLGFKNLGQQLFFKIKKITFGESKTELLAVTNWLFLGPNIFGGQKGFFGSQIYFLEGQKFTFFGSEIYFLEVKKLNFMG